MRPVVFFKPISSSVASLELKAIFASPEPCGPTTTLASANNRIAAFKGNCFVVNTEKEAPYWTTNAVSAVIKSASFINPLPLASDLEIYTTEDFGREPSTMPTERHAEDRRRRSPSREVRVRVGIGVRVQIWVTVRARGRRALTWGTKISRRAIHGIKRWSPVYRHKSFYDEPGPIRVRVRSFYDEPGLIRVRVR